MLRYNASDIIDKHFASGRECRITTIDNRTMYVKKPVCRKCKDRDGKHRFNPTWIANEVVFSTFAKAADLRMPDVCMIELQDQTCFGSEILGGRNNVERKCDSQVQRLARLAVEQANYSQVVRAMLLDIAILNSDRHANNFLTDNAGLIWFYDHDACLWGDGYAPEMNGDMGRVTITELVKRKPEEWICDYLKSRSLCRAVWNSASIESVLRHEMKTLPLQIGYFDEARSVMPKEWVTDFRAKFTCEFLIEWWSRIREFFQRPDAIAIVRNKVDALDSE